MKITDFKMGDKIRLPEWEDEEYVELNGGGLIDRHFEQYSPRYHDIKSDNWQHYQEPKKEKNKKTWYLVVYQLSHEKKPLISEFLYTDLDDFYSFQSAKLDDFVFEPKLINPVEIEYD